MKPITKKLRPTGNYNLFHDSKADVAVLMEYCNMLTDKINELNEELKQTKKELEETKQLAMI